MEKILVLTVGVGDKSNLEDTLFKPLKKSINDGDWTKVVLLPSVETGTVANELKEQNPDIPISISPLPEVDMENNVTKCFKHFDEVIEKLLGENRTVAADFTRGTKAMSAALVLAAVRNNVRQLRYVYGGRDERGTVVPGTEDIGEFDTRFVFGRAKLDSARNLIAKGNYSASMLVLPPNLDNWFTELEFPRELHDEIKGIKQMAEFFSAWDRFDYKNAVRLLTGLDLIAKEIDPLGKLSTITDWQSVKSWLDQLSSDKNNKGPSEMEKKLKYRIVDLFANCERRVYHSQFEDAMVRTFSIIEMIGQKKLFGHGIDSAKVSLNDLRNVGISNNTNNWIFNGNLISPESKRTLSQRKVLKVIGELGESIAEDLLNFDKSLPRLRNESILIHGHEARAPQNKEEFIESLSKLKNIICKDSPEMSESFEIARFLKLDW